MTSRAVSAIIFSSALILLASCGDNKNQIQTKGIKINELAPAEGNLRNAQKEQLQIQVLHSTNLNVITYELAADKISALDAIWQNLSIEPLRYNDANGFWANNLRAGAGTTRVFAKIISTLQASGAKKLFTTTLMIQSNQPEMVDMARLNGRTLVSYIGREGLTQHNEMGPGNLAIQVMARQLPPDLKTGANIRGASVQVTPVIYSSTEGLSPQLANQVRANDLRIYSAGFGMNIKPGEFIVLAPAEVSGDEKKAGDRFFIKQEKPATIRILLFICTSIT